jgi:creatinase
VSSKRSAVGVPEHEVALHSTATMVREIAKRLAQCELMDTWTWFQSGVNTDGAHNPVTNRKIRRGDILSLNCFPMVAGYYVAIERTLFAETASKEHTACGKSTAMSMTRARSCLCRARSARTSPRQLNEIYAK